MQKNIFNLTRQRQAVRLNNVLDDPDTVRLSSHCVDASADKSAELNDNKQDVDLIIRAVAVTLNINPTKRMNKKLWRNYTYDEQRQLMLRLEKSCRKHTGTLSQTKAQNFLLKPIRLLELHFEECPKLKQIHFHALYDMSEESEVIYTEWMKKRCDNTTDKTLKQWRHLVIEELPNDCDVHYWKEYIRKCT